VFRTVPIGELLLGPVLLHLPRRLGFGYCVVASRGLTRQRLRHIAPRLRHRSNGLCGLRHRPGLSRGSLPPIRSLRLASGRLLPRRLLPRRLLPRRWRRLRAWHLDDNRALRLLSRQQGFEDDDANSDEH
jgi:hypothetical protein